MQWLTWPVDILLRVATAREKSGKNKKFSRSGKTQGKSLILSKSVKSSGNSVFRFIVHKFSSTLWNAFSFRKDEKYAVKQAQQSIWHWLYAWHTPVCSSCGQWFSFWLLSSKFLLPLTRKAERGWKWREKYWQPAKKAKANVNIDCFSLIKGLWKVGEKSRNF